MSARRAWRRLCLACFGLALVVVAVMSGGGGVTRLAAHPIEALVVVGAVVGFLVGVRRELQASTGRVTPLSRAIDRFAQHDAAVASLLIVAAVALATFCAPILAPYDPQARVATTSGPPSWAHLLGTDDIGRDVLSRLLYGGRLSFLIGALAVVLATSVGTFVGTLAGLLGGWPDRVAMWLVDVLLALPRLVLLLALVGATDAYGAAAVGLMIVVLASTGWMGVARVVRNQVRSLRERDFVQAAFVLGASRWRVAWRHIVPNSAGTVLVFASAAMGSTLLAEAGLSFLGLGVPPPEPTWGTMVVDGQGSSVFRANPMAILAPGLLVGVVVTAFNLIGDGLRDAFDPRSGG